MEITVNEDQQIQIERVFNGVKFVTINGEELSVCMRDTGYELVYEGTPIELKNGVVNESQSARIRELEQKEQGLEKAFSPLLKANEELENRIRELEEALENADRFIRNGVEFGYIELPAAGDPAHNTLDRIKQALNKTKTE